VSTLETFDDFENGHYIMKLIIRICIMYIISIMFLAGWLKSNGSQILYELDHRKPIMYVIPIENILGKLLLVPVGDTGTIPHHLRNLFPGAPGGCW
jgi:hypothetical protein